MFRYKLLGKKGEGTFSEVIKAQNIETGSFHAIKCMKQRFANVDEVNRLREIQSLRRLSTHPNVVILDEVLFDKPSGKLALVFELLSANLYEVIRGNTQFSKSF